MSLALVGVLAAALLAVPLSRPVPASACSLAGFATAEERIQRQVHAADVILVGEVIEERETGDWGIVPRVPQYASTVRVVAVLEGDAPATVIIRELGALMADCGGGPRMMEGERVLLFLTHGDPRYARVDSAEPDTLRVAATGRGKYRLVDGEAFFERSYARDAPPEPAGSAASLLQAVARLVGTPATELNRAVAFAEGTAQGNSAAAARAGDRQGNAATVASTDAPAPSAPGRWPLLALAAAMLLAAVGALLRRRIRPGGTGSDRSVESA